MITLKDQTLEEIRILIDHTITNTKNVHSFDIVEKSLKGIEKSKDSVGIRRSLSYEISAEIDENIAESFRGIEHEFQQIFKRHAIAVEIANSQK